MCPVTKAGLDHDHLGQSGQVLSRSNGADQLCKISGFWPGFCIGSCALIVASGSDQSDEISILDSNDGSISPQYWLYN